MGKAKRNPSVHDGDGFRGPINRVPLRHRPALGRSTHPTRCACAAHHRPWAQVGSCGSAALGATGLGHIARRMSRAKRNPSVHPSDGGRMPQVGLPSSAQPTCYPTVEDLAVGDVMVPEPPPVDEWVGLPRLSQSAHRLRKDLVNMRTLGRRCIVRQMLVIGEAWQFREVRGAVIAEDQGGVDARRTPRAASTPCR